MLGQQGVFAVAMDVSEENAAKIDLWRIIFAGLVGCRPDDLNNFNVAGFIAESRWVLHLTCWSSSVHSKPPGSPSYAGLGHFLFIDKTGKCIHHCHVGLTAEWLWRQDGNALTAWLHIWALAISFLHCKNVKSEEVEDDRGERWHRRCKTPKFTFRTLDIDPMKTVLRSEGRSDEVGIKKALHICRGHFATYSEDKPLFGKVVGTFFRPDHVRGQIESGMVKKDYRIR